MFCSTVIPTIGRPSLATAVESVLNQDVRPDRFEVIVVNDSGGVLPPGDWQESDRVTIVHTNRRNRSVARNTGAAIARGQYLHFLDDDDWLFPDAFRCLWELAGSADVCWIHGAFRLVDNVGRRIVDIHPTEKGNCSIQLMAWEWLPLQASIISSNAFFEVGGFASLPSLLGGFEDVDLSRRMSLHGDTANAEVVVAAIRTGEVGSTTNYVDMFRQNRQSRELTLGDPIAFRRLRDSAASSGPHAAYWHGKLAYYYLASARWNARRGRVATATSRVCHAVAGFLAGGRYVSSKAFWVGLTTPHYPRMGSALQQAGADGLYAEARRRMDMLDRA